MLEIMCGTTGRACLITGVLVLVVSMCTVIKWRWAMNLDLEWEMKRLYLMQWPRLLSGLGVICLMFGLVGSVGQIGGMFFQSCHGGFPRCIRSLIPLFWGGFFFFLAWIQYGFYLVLIARVEKSLSAEGGNDSVAS